jgi:hypothetical protein
VQPAAAPQRARERGRGRGRLLGALLVLVLAAVIAAVAIVATPTQTTVKLRQVVYSDVQRTAGALKQLVSENTK